MTKSREGGRTAEANGIMSKAVDREWKRRYDVSITMDDWEMTGGAA